LKSFEEIPRLASTARPELRSEGADLLAPQRQHDEVEREERLWTQIPSKT
jgi:hypothetical protein